MKPSKRLHNFAIVKRHTVVVWKSLKVHSH